jgi:hypothetical protein
MSNIAIYRPVNYCIASVWLVNGLFCKVLNLVPRHEAIVGRILGQNSSRTFTMLIGLSEICMAVWILIAYKPRLNVLTQMAVVVVMNLIEFMLVPDLLLWGRFNALFALLFILIVYINEFYFNKNQRN